MSLFEVIELTLEFTGLAFFRIRDDRLLLDQTYLFGKRLRFDNIFDPGYAEWLSWRYLRTMKVNQALTLVNDYTFFFIFMVVSKGHVA